MYFRTYSDFCTIQHSFCNRKGECLLSERQEPGLTKDNDQGQIPVNEVRNFRFCKNYHFFGCLQIVIFSKGALPYNSNWININIRCISVVGYCALPMLTGYSMREIKMGHQKDCIFHSTQRPVIPQKNIILQKKRNCVYKRIFPYIIFMIHL
jgi:hypothetical protein